MRCFVITGISKEKGYSIIGQGQIDGILSDSPEEREREKFLMRQQVLLNLREERIPDQKTGRTPEPDQVTDILSRACRHEPLEKQSQRQQEFIFPKRLLRAGCEYVPDGVCCCSQKELKELEEKHITAAESAEGYPEFPMTDQGAEYERLEQEHGNLNSKMDALHISGQEQAIRKQQLGRKLDQCIK